MCNTLLKTYSREKIQVADISPEQMVCYIHREYPSNCLLHHRESPPCLSTETPGLLVEYQSNCYLGGHDNRRMMYHALLRYKLPDGNNTQGIVVGDEGNIQNGLGTIRSDMCILYYCVCDLFYNLAT